MRISRRTSGGRGEYEISENTAGGITPRDLFDKRIYMQLSPDWTIDSAVRLTFQGGKRRLRRISGGMQLQRQVVAALLMPHAVRADEALGRGARVMLADRYAIEHIDVVSATLVGDDEVLLQLGSLTLRNLSHHAEQVSLTDRTAKIRQLWQHKSELPEYLSALIDEHERLVTRGLPVPERAETVVEHLQRLTTQHAADFGLIYRSEAEDVLPDLLETLTEAPPPPAITVDEIDPDETQIKRRTVKEWKRWAASRGAASARFRQAVRKAWRSTCAVCGLHLPATTFNSTPGVDAAHILPWAEYELDHVSNGLCLCKLHHWAFDEGLILIRVEADQYIVDIPTGMQQTFGSDSEEFSLSCLEVVTGIIPEHRLPRIIQDRPKAAYLQLLRESS